MHYFKFARYTLIRHKFYTLLQINSRVTFFTILHEKEKDSDIIKYICSRTNLANFDYSKSDVYILESSLSKIFIQYLFPLRTRNPLKKNSICYLKTENRR